MAPIQWLLEIEASGERCQALLARTGSLAVAAYHVARAKCQTHPTSSQVPTRTEIRAAAGWITQRLGLSGGVPPASYLAMDCEAVGLPVI